MKHEYGVLRRTVEVIGDKPAPAPLCLPQIPHRLAWFRTRVSAMSVFIMGKVSDNYQDSFQNVFSVRLCLLCCYRNTVYVIHCIRHYHAPLQSISVRKVA